MLSASHAKLPGLTAKLLEAGLWLCACTCAVVVGTEQFAAHAASQASLEIVPAAQIVPSAQAAAPVAANAVIGRLEIKALGLSVPMMQGYDAASLVRGVGHVPGTAVPGGLGNLVLAGHRDTFFRPLRRIRPGMEITVVDAAGTWAYQVDRTEIVMPDAVRVLDIGDQPEMTLITCYPFEFIGAAPQRFIVHAHLVSADTQ